MKKITTILIVTLACSSNSVEAQVKKSLLISGEDVVKSKVNNILPISEIYYPGKNFEKLAVLGKPLDTVYSKSPVDERWTFYYEGYTLQFVDISGFPELREIVTEGSSSSLTLGDKVITPSGSIKKLVDGLDSARGTYSMEFVENKTKLEKYGDGYSILELFLQKDGKTIDKIVFRRKIL